MIADALDLYFNALVAFWQGIARGGGLQLLLIGLALWWFFSCRCRCGCRQCGCWCGHCRCDEVRIEDDD